MDVPRSASLDDLALTEAEVSFPHRRSLLLSIEEFHRESGLDKSQIRILDWGCGRGAVVFALRDLGYDVYGVDPTSEAIESGRQLARVRGLDAEEVLKVFDAEGGTPYPDEFFDFTYSNQVFEHIEDIDQVACELTRVMKVGGKGIHIFPAQYFVLERHLSMPFVHWLPKNRLRWALIRLFVALGAHAEIPAYRGLSGAERAERIYRFSRDRTFYRPIGRICAAFERAGTRATPDTVHSPTVRSSRLVGAIARQERLAPLLNWMIVRFHTVHLQLERARP